MIVPITITPPNAFSPKLPPSIANLGHDELFLIELQGTLDVHCPETSTKDGQLVGTLNIVDMNKPTLVIGHHLLEGKVVNLTKPLGVLHKHADGQRAPSREAEDRSEGGGEGESVRWDISAVVKKKMVFSQRPMPIASSKPASTASRTTRRT